MADSETLARGKLDRVASWVGTSVASAFFASLERCSCINVSTTDAEEEDAEEAKDRPLMLTKQISHGFADVAITIADHDKIPPV